MSSPKTINQSPKISDDILFQFNITDDNGDSISPYIINKAVVYFLSRDFAEGNYNELPPEASNESDLTTYFNKAQVIKIFGSDDVPLWENSSQEESVVTETTTGSYDLIWRPEFAREGDYIFCYTWTPIIAGEKSSNYFKFSLASDTQITTTIPTHITNPNKYNTLQERYLPEYLKVSLGDGDLTPTVLNKLSQAISDGFIVLEDLANQIVDLQDANAVSDQLLLFLANYFNVKLRSTDITAWRRQIKRAVPLYKKKGTLPGLIEALGQAKIKFNGLTRYWQVSSPYSWTESFRVTEDQTEFELARIPNDLIDFELAIRPVGEDEYESLSTDYATITYLEDEYKYILTWRGETVDDEPITLIDGDLIKVKYYVSSPVDENLEQYIQLLPVADTRDERDVTFPLKNWNIRLIEETDPLFSTICPIKNPYRDLLVYGKVRTEFPFSENIYNMETYNGSLRDSNNPCDLSKTFMDDCTCCMSSKYSIDIEIDEISTNRIAEADEIIEEYTPFHAQPYAVNVAAGINELVPPAQEDVEILVNYAPQDQVVGAQMLFNRFMGDGYTSGNDIKREMLASATEVAASTGIGTNDYFVLYSPEVNFDINALGIDYDNNVLEILSGPDQGEYRISASIGKKAVIAQGEPDSIEFPLNEDSFPFRLSNEIFNGSVSSITQVDKFYFSDNSRQFRLSGVVPGWKIVVTSPGDVAGTYEILDSYPNDTVLLDGWTGVSPSSEITYTLYTDSMVQVGDESDSGEVSVVREGLVNGGTDFVIDYQIQNDDVVIIGPKKYSVVNIDSDDEFTISNYTAGSVGATNCKIHRRLVEQAVGYLGVSGLILTTSDNYEADLAISNGNNSINPLIEDSQFKENFLVLIDTTYYQILEIDGPVITLMGPTQNWGLTGTSVDFSIVQFTKLPVTINGQTLEFVDRRSNGVVVIGDSITSLSFAANTLNSLNSQANDTQYQKEGVSIQIEYVD